MMLQKVSSQNIGLLTLYREQQENQRQLIRILKKSSVASGMKSQTSRRQIDSYQLKCKKKEKHQKNSSRVSFWEDDANKGIQSKYQKSQETKSHPTQSIEENNRLSSIVLNKFLQKCLKAKKPHKKQFLETKTRNTSSSKAFQQFIKQKQTKPSNLINQVQQNQESMRNKKKQSIRQIQKSRYSILKEIKQQELDFQNKKVNVINYVPFGKQNKQSNTDTDHRYKYSIRIPKTLKGSNEGNPLISLKTQKSSKKHQNNQQLEHISHRLKNRKYNSFESQSKQIFSLPQISKSISSSFALKCKKQKNQIFCTHNFHKLLIQSIRKQQLLKDYSVKRKPVSINMNCYLGQAVPQIDWTQKSKDFYQQIIKSVKNQC